MKHNIENLIDNEFNRIYDATANDADENKYSGVTFDRKAYRAKNREALALKQREYRKKIKALKEKN